MSSRNTYLDFHRTEGSFEGWVCEYSPENTFRNRMLGTEIGMEEAGNSVLAMQGLVHCMLETGIPPAL